MIAERQVLVKVTMPQFPNAPPWDMRYAWDELYGKDVDYIKRDLFLKALALPKGEGALKICAVGNPTPWNLPLSCIIEQLPEPDTMHVEAWIHPGTRSWMRLQEMYPQGAQSWIAAPLPLPDRDVAMDRQSVPAGAEGQEVREVPTDTGVRDGDGAPGSGSEGEWSWSWGWQGV